jgi:hypothetical protein
MLLSFSCKTRSVCPSCGKKRQLLFSQFVAEEVIQPVPHRQVVFTIPKRLRPFFATRRKRLARLARAGYLTLRKALQKASSSRLGQPGAINSIQTFGSLLDWHPHLHILVTWGVFDRDGSFHEALECPRAEALQADFRDRVFRLLLKEDAIDLTTVESMKAWPHSGFGANLSAPIDVYRRSDGSCRAPGNLLEYFVRPSVSLKRLELTHDGKVLLQDDKFHPRHHGNFRVFEAEEFLAVLGQHIPDTNDRLVAYSGVYSNRLQKITQAKDPKPAGPLPPPLGPSPAPDSPSRKIPRSSVWARLIAFVWEVDPLLCPACGQEMKIVAVITASSVVARILDHRARKKVSGPDPPPRGDPTTGLELTREPFLDDLPWGEG